MKFIKSLSLICIIAVLLCLTVVQSGAETIYVVNGYSYTVADTYSISLCGWDNSSTDLVIPDAIAERNVRYISNYGFQNNTVITSLDFSQSNHLEVIGRYAFSGCTGIANDVILPNTLTYMYDGVFNGCTSLAGVTLGDKLQEIPYGCFQNCSSLSDVIIPDSVTKIGHFAFDGCDSITYLYLSKQIKEIGYKALPDNDELLLGVYYDTYACQYAEENQVDHKILDRQLGDVNFDGVVDILDATEIQKYAAESTNFTPEQFELGDINKDGYCDVIDALLVQKSVIGAYQIPQNIIRY